MAKKDVTVITLQEEPASWLATFGDLATLLFTFYCLIYASCTYRQGSWETEKSPALEKMLSLLAGGTQNSLVMGKGDGPMKGQKGVVALFIHGQEMTPDHAQHLEETLEDLNESGSSQGIDNAAEVERRDEGYVFRLSAPLLFASGRREAGPEADPLLAIIARIARDQQVEVIVEGHTCDLPVGGGASGSNWELAGFRAGSVGRRILDFGIGQSSLYIRSAGEYRPMVENEDETQRRKNRRVEIFINFDKAA
ncbi:MAG: OmpA family protein [Gemmatimonadetes bacterium]|nr:OmpA family protein [Gemmatimonadota bacterium]